MSDQKLSENLAASLSKTDYKNSTTGEEISVKNRKFDSGKYHDSIATLNDFIFPNSSLDWQNLKGFENFQFCRTSKILESGMCQLKKGGHLPLHWHKELGKIFYFMGAIFSNFLDFALSNRFDVKIRCCRLLKDIKFYQLSKATEMFIIIRGKAIFTVGIHEKIVGGNGDPTTIFVPGNVPHQVKLRFSIKYRFF